MKRSSKGSRKLSPPNKVSRSEEDGNLEDRDLKNAQDAITGNDVILSTIFEFLSPEELKVCREVDRKWNHVATSTLLIKDECFLRLDYTDQKAAYRSKLRGMYNPYQEIQGVLEKSVKFPISDWVLHSPHSLMEDLCTNYGSTLKSLTFLTINSFDRFQLILRLLPNLEKLTIGKINLDRDYSRRCPKLLVDSPGLVNLKSLRVVKMSDGVENAIFFTDLLRTCEKLSSVQVLEARLVKMVVNEGRQGLMKQILLKPCQYSKGTFGKIALDLNSVAEVTIDCARVADEQSNSLDLLFRNNQRTLKSLKMSPITFFTNIAPVHKFPNLQRLIFENPIALAMEAGDPLGRGFVAPVPLIPPFLFPFFLMWVPVVGDYEEDFPADPDEEGEMVQVQMTQEMAPSLKTVVFETKVELQNFHTLASVENLEISCEWKRFPDLSRTFPNLKMLKLKGTRIKVSRFNQFQFWKRLPQGLEFLDIYWDTFDFHGYSNLCFDAVFTGGALPKLISSKDTSKAGLVVSRHSSSILCLHRLKSVRIILDDLKVIKSYRFLDRCQLSTHSYEFAFQFLPFTQLVIAYDRSRMSGVNDEMDARFKAMVPFARFEHHKWDTPPKCLPTGSVEL